MSSVAEVLFVGVRVSQVHVRVSFYTPKNRLETGLEGETGLESSNSADAFYCLKPLDPFGTENKSSQIYK